MVYVPDYFQTDNDDPDIQYTLGRQELDSILSEKIEQGIQRIHGLLEKAGISPASVAMCLATGGMVNMPIIKSRLREIFGPQRLNVSERGNTIISEGAAWIANDKTNLTLAKNVELLVARNSYFPVIKAGAKMPREGEVQKTELLSLYCTDPRDGVAKFQIVSPIKPGRSIQKTDSRDTLNILSIQVDEKAKPFFERLELQINIDENLILNAKAKSLLKSDEDKVEIHNLEFGLDLPMLNEPHDRYESIHINRTEAGHDQGGLSLRPNITESDSKPLSLVPGEFLNQYNPYYFHNDIRNEVPEIQKLEKLYYQPCSICKLPSNHPQCRCASSL